MRIAGQYSSALNSSSLADDALHHNTDIIAAVALSNDIGGLLIRAKYAGDRKAVVALYGVWRLETRAVAKGWIKHADEIADISLQHWLDDKCPTCTGTQYEVIAGTPALSATVCPTCSGGGHKILRCDANIRERVLDRIHSLNAIVSKTSSKARRLLDN